MYESTFVLSYSCTLYTYNVVHYTYTCYYGCNKIRRSFTTLTVHVHIQYTCTCTVSPLGPTTFIRQRTCTRTCSCTCSCTFVRKYESTKVLSYDTKVLSKYFRTTLVPSYNVVRKYESTFVRKYFRTKVSICEDRIVVHYVHCTRTVRVQLYTYHSRTPTTVYEDMYLRKYFRTKVRKYTYYLRRYFRTKV